MLEFVVHVYVILRQEYCYNVILYGLPNTTLQILQQIQNYAARMIVRFGKDEYMTHGLHDLHWLPIKLRVHFKVLPILKDKMNMHHPIYVIYKPVKPLRTGSQCMLVVSKIRTKGYGGRKSSYAAATSWNTQTVL